MKPRSATGFCAVAGVTSVALGWWAAGMLTAPARVPVRPTLAAPTKPARPGTAASGNLDAGCAAVWAAGDASAQMAAAVAMAESVAPVDFARFLEMLDRLPAHAAQGLATRTILRRWTALDPPAALQWCLDHNGDLTAGVAGEWARLEPAKAGNILDLVSTSPGESKRRGLQNVRGAAAEIFKALVSLDREAAMGLLVHPKLHGAIGDIDQSLRTLARQDTAWMLAQSETLSDWIRPWVRAAVAQAMAETSAPDALVWAREQPDRNTLVTQLMQETRDPSALLAELASWSPEEQKGLHGGSYHTWAKADPARLVEAIETYGSRLPWRIVTDLLGSAADYLLPTSDPGALANRLLALPAAVDNFRAADFALSWARKSPEDARAWALSLSDETQRQQAVEAVNAFTTVSTAVPARSLADELTHQAGQGNWSDGQQFLALTESERRQVLDAGLPRLVKNHESDPFAIASLVSIGARYPTEVAEWMTSALTAESTPLLMETLTAAASAWAGENPAAAAEWAATLPPGEARAWAAANVAGQWRLFDEAAARAWIETLPPDERAIAVKAVPELLVSP